VGDQQATQLEATLDVARERLKDMERKRDELTAAVDDLREQMKMVEDMLSTVGTVKDAAE
jgi:phage shock protein A